jgi:hypothetical protein
MEIVPMSFQENGCSYYAMAFIDDMRDKFRSLIGEGAQFKSVNHMATETGIEQKSLKRFLDGDGALTMSVAARAFDMLGATIEITGGQSAQRGDRYKPTAFDEELRGYLNGMITIQKKTALKVSEQAAHGESQTQERIFTFLQGNGPLWASDLPSIANTLGQTPEQVIKIVSEMTSAAENVDSIQQTLAS